MTESTFSTRRLMAEIEAEARARRVGGSLPRSYELDLDEKFQRLVPKSSGNDFTGLLRRAQQDAMFDYSPPTASARRGGTAVKKGLSKLTSWYIRHLGQQMTSFAFSITGAVRALGERLEAIEETQLGPDALPTATIDRDALTFTTISRWNQHVVDLLKGATGRVLVARAGNGSLVRQLVEHNIDAYGIEPGDPHRITDVDPNLDVRSQELLPHLRAIQEPELSGAVLIGLTDTLAPGTAGNILELLRDALVPGATLAVVTTDPHQWRREHDGVVADLNVGHPLAPATWVELLHAYGYEDVDLVSAESTAIVRHVPGDDAVTAAINEQLRALEAAVVFPPSHCISARLPE